MNNKFSRHIILTGIILTLLSFIVVPAYAQGIVTYVVKDGDTLGEIATAYCTSWTDIYEANEEEIGDNPNVIWIGISLSIVNLCEGGDATGGPTGQSATGVYDRGEREYADGTLDGDTYTVASGDTVFSITERFGVTIDQLEEANEDLSEDGLKAGTDIIIPEITVGTAPTTDEVTGTTDTEDTATTETQEATDTEDTATTETQEATDTEDTTTPDTATEDTASTDEEDTTSASAQAVVVIDRGATEYAEGQLNDFNRYIVSQGDTIFSVAARFGVSVEALLDANEGASDRGLYAGEHLVIPGLTTDAS